MTERRTGLDALAIVLMVALCVLWGLNQVAAKVANESVSPLMQAGLRSIGAALLLWIWCFWRRIPLFERDGSLLPGIAAGVLFGAEFGLMFLGLRFTTASRAVVFLYTAPFVVAIGLHWLVPAERLRLPQVVGLLCAFAGVVAAFSEGLRAGAGRLWIGDALLLISATLWGATTVLVRASVLVSINSAKTLFYQLAISAVMLPIVSLAVGEPGFTNPTLIGVASIVWQTVLVAFASYLVWFWLITRYPATRLAAFTFLTPLFGMIFGAWLLGETIAPLLALGLALVAVGIWLVNWRPGYLRQAANQETLAAEDGEKSR